MNAEDAIEMMMAGASAVQVGTANFVNPKAPLEILAGIQSYATQEKVRHLRDIVGVIA